jgi:hypothetical protein
LEPLSVTAISSLVSRTLRRPKEDIQPLSQLVYAASLGNAFSIRNVLITLQRQRFVRKSLYICHESYSYVFRLLTIGRIIGGILTLELSRQVLHRSGRKQIRTTFQFSSRSCVDCTKMPVGICSGLLSLAQRKLICCLNTDSGVHRQLP